MRELVGRPGTWGGLWLRLGQAALAAASIAVMASAYGFAGYTAFCYLIASMGLQALWSLGLACLDGYALKVKRDLSNAVLVSLFVVGDWDTCLAASTHITLMTFQLQQMGALVTAILSFAASCSAAGVIVLFERDISFCRRFYQLPCGKFQLATAFAFLSWALSATSAVIMFWLLASF